MTIAAEGLRRIAEIYKIETKICGICPDQRLAVRQEQSSPLVADFRLWLTKHRSVVRENDPWDRFLILTTSAKSRLGEKLGYVHRRWDGLQIFLTDGRVEIDTNPVENTIGPITLKRKNALFAGHDEDGHTWARMASLIETCKLNAVYPYAHLRATLAAIAIAIANRHPASRVDHLMPWAVQQPSS